MFEKVVFFKFCVKFGGCVCYMFIGFVLISVEVMEFLCIVFGCVFEGYGMMEFACVILKTA